ncbi:MAG: hypothetical protein QOE45_1175 [Frankiaceae bacterium]|jgi:hypothetical protein|nr:hypothetical protein [Frankiaceae bacterium]
MTEGTNGDGQAARVGLGDRLRHALANKEPSAPLYPRLLRLKNVHPNGWQRAALVEGMAIVGGLVALADRASSWAPVILPVAAAGVVKFHDVLAGVLPARRAHRAAGAAPDDGAGSTSG